MFVIRIFNCFVVWFILHIHVSIILGFFQDESFWITKAKNFIIYFIVQKITHVPHDHVRGGQGGLPPHHS